MQNLEPPKTQGRPKLVLDPEQEAQRKERRRRQMADAQARRRTRLVGALRQAEHVSKEAQELHAQVKSLQDSVAWHKERQLTLERAYDRLEAENKKLRDNQTRSSGKAARSPEPLNGRVEAIVQEMTTYSSGKEIVFLESQVNLAKKWATEAKGTSTKVETFLAVTTGQRVLLGKAVASARFATPILSEDERRVLTHAMIVLGRIAADVDSAAHSVASLHKQRELESQERAKKARRALAIFDKLDVDDKIRLVAMNHTRHDTGWGPFRDLVRGLYRPDNRDRWWKATDYFEEAYKERFSNLVHHLADAMKESGRAADDLASEAFQKFQDLKPKIEQEWPDLVSKIKTALVIERLEQS